jgi:dihydrofolate synthase/folylpolyglutamate synthase
VLEDFLNNKPLFYNEIDYTRMPRVWERIKDKFRLPKIIHLIGTNGKGTTGRFLATALLRAGYSVGHYTSPHILEFNERIWLNGQSAKNALLEENHQKLLELLTQEERDSLSYFEYTTLLAMLLYSQAGVEYVVLEAGLGGEHDATAVFENELTLLTPVDYDHEAFLGTTIEEIATTKLSAVQKATIVAKQKHKEVYDIALKLSKSKDFLVYNVQKCVSSEDLQMLTQIAQEEKLPHYLYENMMLAVAALKYFKISYSAENFQNARLFGRLSKVRENIFVDVGHNKLAAEAIVKFFADKKVVLIYNSYKDKAYKEILEILQPIIKRVEVIEVDDMRIESEEKLRKVLERLEIPHKKFQFEAMREDEFYLVFGSFSVAEAFLKGLRG